MSGPAATITHMHTCPMYSGYTPHTGGPIIGSGVPTVLIGGKPAAVMGDTCTCVGPPDTIVQGEATVLIGGKPAATIGSMTAHGGVITEGDPTVLIGTGTSSKTAIMPLKRIPFPKINFVNRISGRNRAAIENQEALSNTEEKDITVSNLEWKLEEETISEAFVGDTIKICATVTGENAIEGMYLSFIIYEKDEATEDDFVKSVMGKIENGAIEIEWDIMYMEDNDDTKSAQELQEQAYTLPEYVFIHETHNGETLESGLLTVKDNLELNVINGETEEPLANANYTIALPNGELLEGQLDANGYALVEGLSSSKNYPVVFSLEGEIITTSKY